MSEISNLFVCLMGMGVTFFGLIILIMLISLLRHFAGDKTPAAAPAAAPTVSAAAIPNRQELVAAISAAVAEELGEDISAIRILSLKKLS